MTEANSGVPIEKYGVFLQDEYVSELQDIAEQVRRLGYAILDSGFSKADIGYISEAFEKTRSDYLQKYGESRLRAADELYTIRAPLAHGDPAFIRLATNEKLLQVLRMLIVGKFILNQQNGIINPPQKNYNQGSWHRDLPYQHFTSSSPLAINALYCVDDFTVHNGSTFVLPATHKAINYPANSYIARNAVQVEAKAGQYILLDCMLFHSGGYNQTNLERRAVNHVYTIPYFRQQIKLSTLITQTKLGGELEELFGFQFQEVHSIEKFIENRINKND